MPPITPPHWVETRDYQQRAVNSWFESACRGIFHMATGTGKTVTALLAVSKATKALDRPMVLVVAAPYQHLVDQWASELSEFGTDPVLAYKSRRNWQPRLERELLEFKTGARDLCTVVTTHQTLSMSSARRTIERASGPMMFVADEVHHLGASHQQNALLNSFDLRLGLSATPNRWYDDEGTEALNDYFGGKVFDYSLQRAIDAGDLCEYYYVPHIVELQDDEMDEYLALTAKIGRLMTQEDGADSNLTLDGNDALQSALFKRARLIGTAHAKLSLLVTLLNRESELAHTLVYCSDGSTGVGEKGQRHVDAVTDRLDSEFDTDVRRFTAREGQSNRQQLLEAFETGDLEILTSIRCLDEGIDVPATRRAYILASTSNPRQYVQRRGRILRPHENKSHAVIHDFVTVPDTESHPEMLSEDRYSAERTLIQKELKRVTTFVAGARNHPDAELDGVPTTDGSLREIKRQYDLLTV